MYYNRSEAPLKFHHALRFFFIPITLLYWVFVLLPDDIRAVYFDNGGVFDLLDPLTQLLTIGFHGIVILACLAAIVFLFGSRSFYKVAYIGVMTFALCLVVKQVLQILVVARVNASTVSENVPALIGAAIWAGILMLYYYKRKPLFYPELIPDESDDTEQAAPPEEGSVQYDALMRYRQRMREEREKAAEAEALMRQQLSILSGKKAEQEPVEEPVEKPVEEPATESPHPEPSSPAAPPAAPQPEPQEDVDLTLYAESRKLSPEEKQELLDFLRFQQARKSKK